MNIQDFYASLIIAGGYTLLMLFASGKFLLALQQLGYRGHRYYRWLYSKRNPYRARIMLLSLLSFLCYTVIGITFVDIVPEWLAPYFGFIAPVFFICAYIHTESSVNVKISLKITRRMLRQILTYVIVLFAVMLGATCFLTAFSNIFDGAGGKIFDVLKFSLLSFMPMLAPLLLLVAYGINRPFEKINNRRYIEITRKKLAESNLIKIGITGSFGKTSVKEILSTLLSVKFRVLATPASYNTPLGISLAIKKLDATHDVFIAEMGAREVGDISELSKIVQPNIAVLTGVNSQHLETFKNIDNIKKTKYELFENLPLDGKAFFDVSNRLSSELSQKFNGEKYLANGNGELLSALDIKTTSDGTTFKITDGKEVVQCVTTLIGKHSVNNIMLSATVAYKVGLSLSEIACGITRLHSVKHRLEVLPNNKGVTLIDDSYNSNTDGFLCALDTIAQFDGRKIVVTPGIVELGHDQYQTNYEIGKKLATSCDKLVISAKHNAEAIINGFVDEGGNKENIAYKPNFIDAKKFVSEILQAGDIVLFENDLPDIYN